VTVYVGAVKDGISALDALIRAAGNLETADSLIVAGIDKALRNLNEELDLRVGELDAEIIGDEAVSAFGLPSGVDPLAAIPQVQLEAANAEQMTRLLGARAYSGRIDRLMDQVR
jgi:hypothetical protein